MPGSLSIAVPAVLQAVTGALVYVGFRRMKASLRSLEELRRRLDSLSEMLDSVRAKTVPPPKADPPYEAPIAKPAELAVHAGINLTRRSRALLLHRQGYPAAQIAAIIGTPGNEVELLLKVHHLTNGARGPASSSKP